MASTARICRACQRRLGEVAYNIPTYSWTPVRYLPIRSTIEHGPQHQRNSRSLHSTSFKRLADLRQSEHQTPSTDTNSSSITPEVSDASITSVASINTPQSTSETSIPWYLRVEPPEPPTPTSPHLAAQELPPLPSNSPDLLLPLMQHLSISIGLDNLSLLDLRDLSPPSALGANLLMVIGTARSHKHLNTSADRFCRWLRSTYKLRPYADGLLGRNELKLKLRRRNKRLKLAQSVGNTTAIGGEDGSGKYDSGITTGWICCNIGAVGQAIAANVVSNAVEGNTKTNEHLEHAMLSVKDQERILEDEEAEYVNPTDQDFKYRGFGSASNAPRIVVQMFTEEKRLEMDLEGLWESRIQRRERKEEKLDQELSDRLFETGKIEEDLAGDETTVREGMKEFRPVHA